MPAAFQDQAQAQALALVAQHPAYAGAADGFDFNSVPGLALDFNAADLATLTITSPPDVDAAADQSSTGEDVAQTTGAAKPHSGASIGGLNAIEHDGVDDYLLNSTPGGVLSGTSGTIFAVYKAPSVLSAGVPVLFGNADEGSPDRNFWIGPYRGSASPNMTIQSANGGPADGVRGTTAIVAGTSYIMRFRATTSYELALNGVVESLVVVSGSNNGRWAGQVSARDSFTIGALRRTSTTLFLDGSWSRLLVYQGSMTAQDTIDIEAALSEIYGIPVSP